MYAGVDVSSKGMEYRENVRLAPFTTFQIGGPARWFVDVTSEQEVLDAVRFAKQRDLPLLVLGGGSNLLVADEGFTGLAMRMASSGVTELPAGAERRRFAVAAGVNWDEFVSLAVVQGCGGIECLAGIPGTVGGTPIQNVGAYGQEVSSTIAGVRALDLTTLQYVDLPNAACGFAYRTSIFNGVARGRYVVTAVVFELSTSAESMISYKDVALCFKGRADGPSQAEVAAAVRVIRRSKGMLLVPGEEDCRSAGSFFKNPWIAKDRLAVVAAVLGMDAVDVPQFPAADGQVKVPAAWILDQAGFHKGYRLGRAGISSRHTLALINTGGATAGEILALRDQIVARVRERFGIELETEPVMVRP